MDTSSRVSPLRQRMLDDMRMRKLSEKTQSHYLRWVQRFAAFLGRSPDTATVEELRRYQLHLVEYATLEWVDWFNHRRLLEPIGNVPPAELEASYYQSTSQLPMAA